MAASAALALAVKPGAAAAVAAHTCAPRCSLGSACQAASHSEWDRCYSEGESDAYVCNGLLPWHTTEASLIQFKGAEPAVTNTQMLAIPFYCRY